LCRIPDVAGNHRIDDEEFARLDRHARDVRARRNRKHSAEQRGDPKPSLVELRRVVYTDDHGIRPALERERPEAMHREHGGGMRDHGFSREPHRIGAERSNDLLAEKRPERTDRGQITLRGRSGDERSEHGVGEDDHTCASSATHTPLREVELVKGSRVEPRLGHFTLQFGTVYEQGRDRVKSMHIRPPLLPWVVGLALWVWGSPMAGAARAQVLPGVDDYAAAISALTAPIWAGPRAALPIERDRPEALIHGRSLDFPLAVHGAPDARPEALEAALRGAGRMFSALRARGWAAPFPDGDLGGGPELDLYLADSASAPYEIVSDGPTAATYLDGLITHVRLDGRLPLPVLEACAAEAYANALLAELDPAEAPTWRTAVAQYLMWLLDGRFDACTADAPAAQHAPHRGYTAFDGANAGAIFLAARSLRSDDQDGSYVRETWTMARQRTWEGKDEGLRASPDLWEAIATSARLLDQSLDQYLIEGALARLALGAPARERSSTLLALGGLGADYAVPYAYRVSYADLPIRTAPYQPALSPTGSAYTSVDVRGAGDDDRLRIYLRGEAAVRWSLAAVLYDADGRERGHVEAPVRERAWDAYLTVELGEVASVIVVVTNLGEYRPDADVPPVDERTFHLVIDRAHD
jgi:hypothetical protein